MRSARDDADRLLAEPVFRAMFELHYVRVLRYAEGQLSDPSAAEDIANDVFAVAWQKLDPSEPFGLPWLIRTAMFKCRDAQRRAKRGQSAVAAVGQSLSDASDALHEDRLAVHEALQKLSPRERQLVQLTYWDELSAGEIAEVLRIRQGAIWTRLHRARAKLRVLLDDSHAGVN